LHKIGNKVCQYIGVGRSFYICFECLNGDKYLINKISGRLKIDKNSLEEVIKEFSNNGKN